MDICESTRMFQTKQSTIFASVSDSLDDYITHAIVAFLTASSGFDGQSLAASLFV